MSKYVTTLTAALTDLLGKDWSVSMDKSLVVIQHTNGSRSLAWWKADGRRAATPTDTVEMIEQLRRKLATEIPKYKPESADKGRAAIPSLDAALEAARLVA